METIYYELENKVIKISKNTDILITLCVVVFSPCTRWS